PPLADDIDAANGLPAVAPTNRITIFAAPPAGDHGLLFFDSWLRLVTPHELAHVFHLDRSRGLWDGLQRVFGRAPGLFPNEYQPSWVTEGLATYYESKFTNAGRVRGSFHTQVLGADRAAGASRSPWDATLFTRWADGLVACACRRMDGEWRTCGTTGRGRACCACSTPQRDARSPPTASMGAWITTGWAIPSWSRSSTSRAPGGSGATSTAGYRDGRGGA